MTGTAGTHAYDMIAAIAEHEAATTYSLMEMIAAAVMVRAGLAGVQITVADIDAVVRGFEFVPQPPEPGVLSVVLRRRNEPDTSLMVNNDPTLRGPAAPQVVPDNPPAERAFWFARTGGVRRGPMPRHAAEQVALAALRTGDKLAMTENRACARDTCPNSAQQGICPLCAPS